MAGRATEFDSEGKAPLGDGGPAIDAPLKNLGGLDLDYRCRLLIADTDNHRIRLVDIVPDVPGVPAQRADFDTNGWVDFSDFLLFAAAFGGDDDLFDLDGGRDVDFADFIAFAAVFGTLADSLGPPSN